MSTNPMTNQPVIGVVEWSSEAGIEPLVLLGDTAGTVRKSFVNYLHDRLPTEAEPDGDLNYIDLAWMIENPLPDLDDEAAVKAWLDALREATTDAWLTIFTHHQGIDDLYETQYADVRGA